MVKRVVCLFGVLLLLVAALVFLWAHRFEPLPGSRSWQLDDLRGGAPAVSGAEWIGVGERSAIRLWVDQQRAKVALRLTIPGIEPCTMLHLRYRLKARGLTQGDEEWQDGRMIIEWHPAEGGVPEFDPVDGAKDSDASNSDSIIAVSDRGPAIPALRLEHLGKAGEFIVSDLEITPVHHSRIWQTARWLMLAGFLGWIYAFIRQWPVANGGRALAAALLWLAMGLQFVVPGPWKMQRPLVMESFRLGESARASTFAQVPPVLPSGTRPPEAGAVSSTGKVLPRGSFFLQVKLLIKEARFLLHILLLLGPTLVSGWLIGRDPTLWIAILCAAAIELAQMAFGFRFDWLDLIDLVTDAIGIAAGLWLAARFRVPVFRRY